MAITIQDLIASDTVSQAVDKINFNFDQLILNGGGPLGPAGPQGPAGPIGGRGERGSEWYEGTDNPNITPPTVTPLKADYYLQSNGDVWEYTGLTWSNTTINLVGPAGPTGASVGLSQFGNAPSPGDPAGAAPPNNYSGTAKNVGYPSLMPTGSATISTNNEGVPTFAVGIASPSDLAPGGVPIPLTSAFQLTQDFAGQLDSSNTSFLLHQKNSGAAGIRFMGGAGEDMEQSSINKLSNISLSQDDTLNINIPKAPSNITSSTSIIGFNVETTNKSQLYRSGAGFKLETGVMPGPPASSFYDSDFKVIVNSFNPLGSASSGKFNVTTLGAASAGLLQLGGNITVPATSSLDGTFLSEAAEWHVVSSSDIKLNAATRASIVTAGNSVVTTVSAVDVEAVATANVNVIAAGSGDVTIDSANGGNTNVNSLTQVKILQGPGGATDSVMEFNANGILATTGATTANIKLSAAGNGNQLILEAQDSISLQNTADSVIMPKITLALNAVTNRYTDIRGKMGWGTSTTMIPNNLLNAPVYKHEYTDANVADGPILPGSVVRQMGAGSYYTNQGVQFQQYNDGVNEIIIGKPEYSSGITNSLGLFVNDTNVNVPPQFSGASVASENPSTEQFRVDKDTTKISNNLIYGGQRGHQTLNIDPLWDATPINGNTFNVSATTPALRVNIGTLSPIGSRAAIQSLPNGATQANWEADLIINFNPSVMVHGQQFRIEIFNQPSWFRWCNAGCVTATQYGKLNVYIQHISVGGVVRQRLVAESETEASDIVVSGQTREYTCKSNFIDLMFSNMGEEVFYNNSTTDAGGGITVQKGWNSMNLTLTTFNETNVITYSQAPISNPVS